MHQFKIQKNEYLSQETLAFYHADYTGGKYKEAGTMESYIVKLKGDSGDILEAQGWLKKVLSTDLPEIHRIINRPLTVCVVPRAKANYGQKQLQFKETIGIISSKLDGFLDGTNYIIRHTDTKTTHRGEHGGNGKMPYPNITKDTCTISDAVRDKDILLIDDLYTKTRNIDEDAIQALLDKGARSVVFYSVGKTVRRN